MPNIKAAIETLLPAKLHLPLRHSYQRLTGKLDPEMAYVDGLLTNRRRFLDIGCNLGTYSNYFRTRMEHVEAFEPIEEVTSRLKPFLGPKFHLHHCALSDETSELELYIPRDANGALMTYLASLEPKEGAAYERRLVPVKRLNDFYFQDVDLIKMDVEGHEARALAGAARTITTWHPLLLIEIEQRHISGDISEIFRQVLDMGYQGRFLLDGAAHDLSEFRYEQHQAPFLDDALSKKYVNNFIFVPTSAA